MARRLSFSPRLDPVASARAAGLHYSTDAKPGIRRLRNGSGFRYVRPDGRKVTDRADLARIRTLVIPPAWKDVWICPDPRGHLQATGRDARGRKQYRYHPRWREVRDETKYGRLIAFGRALPAIRRRTESDLRRAGLPRSKVLAAVVRLLPLRERHPHFRTPFAEVQLERHQREPFALHVTDQPPDFAGVHEQLSRARGLVVVATTVRIGRDMQVDQKDLSLANDAKCVIEVGLAGAQ